MNTTKQKQILTQMQHKFPPKQWCYVILVVALLQLYSYQGGSYRSTFSGESHQTSSTQLYPSLKRETRNFGGLNELLTMSRIQSSLHSTRISLQWATDCFLNLSKKCLKTSPRSLQHNTQAALAFSRVGKKRIALGTLAESSPPPTFPKVPKSDRYMIGYHPSF